MEFAGNGGNATLQARTTTDQLSLAHVELVDYRNYAFGLLSSSLHGKFVRPSRHGSFEVHHTVHRQHANFCQTTASRQSDFIKYPLLDFAIAHCQYPPSLSAT